jgi:hypothetical protein
LGKSDKFSKIPPSENTPEYNFTLTHLYSNIGSFFTSGKKDLVYFIFNVAGHGFAHLLSKLWGTLSLLEVWYNSAPFKSKKFQTELNDPQCTGV